MAHRRSPKQGDDQQKSDSQAIVAKLENSDVVANDANVAIIQRTYKLLGNRASQVKETELFAASAEESFKVLSENISLNLKELQSHPDTKTAKSLEEGVAKLSELTYELIKSFKARQSIEPRFSIIRPDIKYIDAGLAYKYADLQSDANNLTSFATLFLGTGIAALVSFVVSYMTDKDVASMALYFTTAFMSIVVTIIFGILAISANKKAKQARVILETKDNITEIKIAND